MSQTGKAAFWPTLIRHLKHPSPPAYSRTKIRRFTLTFYSVVLFQVVIVGLLLWLYPDDYLANALSLFYSELGAPVTVFGTPNRMGAMIFSGNMIGAVFGCAAFIPIVQWFFPIPPKGFYRALRYGYLFFIAAVAFGNIGVVFPYTIHWELHVIGALVCMISLWTGWSLFVLFNSPWISLRGRVLLVGLVDLSIWFVLISELAGWKQELFQKPGQGLIFGLVIIWPYIYYRKGPHKP